MNENDIFDSLILNCLTPHHGLDKATLTRLRDRVRNNFSTYVDRCLNELDKPHDGEITD